MTSPREGSVMEISNRTYQIARGDEASWLAAVSRGLASALDADVYPLRLSIVEADAREATVEATIVHFDAGDRHAGSFRDVEIVNPRKRSPRTAPFVAAQIVPTGVRCELGGFAGDAGPATNLLSSAVDVLVTHPNAVNASELNEMAANVLYVEGKGLDDFLLGRVGLVRVVANKIGTFIDPRGIRHIGDVINALNAARAVKGIDCGLHTVLPRAPGVQIEWSGAGCAVGTVLEPGNILDAVELLVGHGAQAIGGVSVIDGVTSAMFAEHLAGRIPNPSGGVEAIITHLISKVFRLPTAHAPLPYYQDLKGKSTRNPRAAAEFISTPHYFSVLKGLAQAATCRDQSARSGSFFGDQRRQCPRHRRSGLMSWRHTGARRGVHDIPPCAKTPRYSMSQTRKCVCATSLRSRPLFEATGVLLALRQGISIESVRRPLRSEFSRRARHRRRGRTGRVGRIRRLSCYPIWTDVGFAAARDERLSAA